MMFVLNEGLQKAAHTKSIMKEKSISLRVALDRISRIDKECRALGGRGIRGGEAIVYAAGNGSTPNKTVPNAFVDYKTNKVSYTLETIVYTSPGGRKGYIGDDMDKDYIVVDFSTHLSVDSDISSGTTVDLGIVLHIRPKAPVYGNNGDIRVELYG